MAAPFARLYQDVERNWCLEWPRDAYRWLSQVTHCTYCSLLYSGYKYELHIHLDRINHFSFHQRTSNSSTQELGCGPWHSGNQSNLREMVWCWNAGKELERQRSHKLPPQERPQRGWPRVKRVMKTVVWPTSLKSWEYTTLTRPPFLKAQNI